jgi:hypothetical protein
MPAPRFVAGRPRAGEGGTHRLKARPTSDHPWCTPADTGFGKLCLEEQGQIRHKPHCHSQGWISDLGPESLPSKES